MAAFSLVTTQNIIPGAGLTHSMRFDNSVVTITGKG